MLSASLNKTLLPSFLPLFNDTICTFNLWLYRCRKNNDKTNISNKKHTHTHTHTHKEKSVTDKIDLRPIVHQVGSYTTELWLLLECYICPCCAPKTVLLSIVWSSNQNVITRIVRKTISTCVHVFHISHYLHDLYSDTLSQRSVNWS